MLIAQISDSHIAGEGKNTFGIAPMAENLARCIDHINKFEPTPDVVLVTGDIGNSGNINEMAQANELLRELSMPYFIIPGNHDDRSTIWSHFGGDACPTRHNEFISYVVDKHPVRLIGLDSTSPGKPGGEICPERARWLDKQLAGEPNKPTIIFMHHPPVKCSVRETDEDGFNGAKVLADVIDKYQNIERILCGHIHLVTHTNWHGTNVSTAPSIGMQLDLDLTISKPSMFHLTTPAYLLHHWTPARNLITHTIEVRETKGPYLFKDQG